MSITEPVREDAVCCFLTLDQLPQSLLGHQPGPCEAAVHWGTVQFIAGVRTVRHGVAASGLSDAGPHPAGKLLGPALPATLGLVREISAVIEVVTADAELDTSVVGAFEELRGTFPNRAIFLRLIRAVQTVRDPVTAELQGNTLGLETVGGGGALELCLAGTG